MIAEYEIGDEVRVTRNVRNDGTFPGLERGDLIMRRGTCGTIVDRGTFLQDQIVYTVHFVGDDRVVGCREEELIPIDAPWNPSKFEFRDKVVALKTFAVNGEVIAEAGAPGEILKVLRETEGEMQYHVRFPGHTLQILESRLDWADPEQAQLEQSA
ncbi:nitrogen fixation protein NifZ [Magnetovibrio sp. PR-2]|uniref:nitrogen fixation protein NifZ n=1 Tax=Magnetovibrio sp. PR-2 TaxID=3120356 RepID=UPI002FCE231E